MKFVMYLSFALFLGACSSDAEVDVSENCKRYCKDAKDNCLGDNSLYDSDDECFSACATLKDRPVDEGRVAGNTIQCRIYHIGVAASNPGTHCPHASVQSTVDTCQDVVTVCDKYCTEYFETCKDEFQIDFKGVLNTCLNDCPAKVPVEGSPQTNDTEDSANCRLSQIGEKNCEGGKLESSVCVDSVP